MKTIAKFVISYLLITTSFAEDLSKDYLQMKQEFANSTSNKAGSAFIKEIQKYKIILVPGILSESFIEESTQFPKINYVMGEMLEDQITWLNSQNIDNELVIVESESHPKKNIEIIKKAILASEKPVILYTHSKGGIDTLYTLEKYPELMDKVSGWTSIQTPFYGSSVASLLKEYSLSQSVSKWALSFLGGSEEGLNSLTKEDRNDYMQRDETPALLNSINKNIAVINFATYIKNSFGLDTSLEIFRDYLEYKDGENDGVVPVSSAVLPGTDHIIESGVDHLTSVGDSSAIKKISFSRRSLETRWTYDRESHIQAILKTLLIKMEKN